MIQPRRPWPELTQTLQGPRHPQRCQGCGSAMNLTRWLEHDTADRPTALVVVLCGQCGEQLIAKHKRLYASLHPNAPHPGAMALCLDCTHRSGVRCLHPALRANGGPGLAITVSPAHTVFYDGMTKGGGRRVGWHEQVYDAPPSACAGRVPREEEGT